LADLLKVKDLTGLEYRKRMTELVEYGCVRMVPANWMVAVTSRSQIAGVSLVKGRFSEYEGAEPAFMARRFHPI
jgi:hypothetical protein